MYGYSSEKRNDPFCVPLLYRRRAFLFSTTTLLVSSFDRYYYDDDDGKRRSRFLEFESLFVFESNECFRSNFSNSKEEKDINHNKYTRALCYLSGFFPRSKKDSYIIAGGRVIKLDRKEKKTWEEPSSPRRSRTPGGTYSSSCWRCA